VRSTAPLAQTPFAGSAGISDTAAGFAAIAAAALIGQCLTCLTANALESAGQLEAREREQMAAEPPPYPQFNTELRGR
jgi:hypothetical protein